jgi:uncharacterized membrane protein
MLIGFGLFNLLEGVVNHQLLGLHHVNETVRHELWIFWDMGYLVWGAAMLLTGLALLRQQRTLGATDRREAVLAIAESSTLRVQASG